MTIDTNNLVAQASNCELRLCCRAEKHAPGCTTYDPARSNSLEFDGIAAQASDEPMRAAWFAFFAEHGAQYGDHKAAQDAFTAGYLAATPRATADVERDNEDRSTWTFKQWYEHVGAWETAEGLISFGSPMAVRAMLIQYGRAALKAQPAPTEAAQGDRVQIPKNADQAELMQKIGLSWLQANAPVRLTDAGRAAQVENSERPEWQRITAPGQVKVGDKLRFTIGDVLYNERVKQIINLGYPDEELIYNKRRNFYVITSNAITNFGSSKNVEYCAGPQSQEKPCPKLS